MTHAISSINALLSAPQPLALPRELPWRKVLPRPKLCERDAFLLALAAGQRVLHVGATDAPLTDERLENGELLHLKLRAVARHLVGVDIDAPSVARLRETTGVDDILLADMTALPPTLDPRLNEPFDLIYCCDVIEHVDNPGGLLAGLRRLCGPQTRVALTTPNALSLKGALRPLFLGKEFAHPDHVAYFSFSTLATLMRRHGLEPVSYGVFAYPTPNALAAAAFNSLYRLSPNSAEGFFLIGAPIIE